MGLPPLQQNSSNFVWRLDDEEFEEDSDYEYEEELQLQERKVRDLNLSAMRG